MMIGSLMTCILDGIWLVDWYEVGTGCVRSLDVVWVWSTPL